MINSVVTSDSSPHEFTIVPNARRIDIEYSSIYLCLCIDCLSLWDTSACWVLDNSCSCWRGYIMNHCSEFQSNLRSSLSYPSQRPWISSDVDWKRTCPRPPIITVFRFFGCRISTTLIIRRYPSIRRCFLLRYNNSGSRSGWQLIAYRSHICCRVMTGVVVIRCDVFLPYREVS